MRRADFELLRAFAQEGDQRALAEVIRRHLDLVYATALRKVVDAGAAEEISQNVFCALGRKAWRFAPDDSLPAWLHKTALLESKAWLRRELRRRRRERVAAELGTTMKTSDESSAFGALVPLLDEALLSLREQDRTALLLRYCEGQPLREVGVALGIEEDAAQKRVASALEKLAAFFQRRGFKSATLATTAAALNQTAASAPAGTAASVTRTALRTAAPTFAGLLALLALLFNLTRVQEVTVVGGVVSVTGLWLWMVHHRNQEAVAQVTAVETSDANIPKSPKRTATVRARTEALDFVQVAEAPSRFVEIKGEIEVFSFRGSETNEAAKGPSRITSFTCVVGTNEWRIEGDFVIGGESKWYFDGTNVYESLRSIESKSEEQEGLVSNTKAKFPFLSPTGAAVSNVTIYVWGSPDGHPLGDPGVNIQWLAFCSGNYLKRNGRLIPLPHDVLRHTPDRFAYSDQTETFDDDYGLPRSVSLFTSKSLFQTSVEDFAREWFSGDRYAEYYRRVTSNLQEGVLTFRYAVTESTNFLGWHLPTRFEYFQKGRHYIQNGDWFHQGMGKVASIRLVEKPKNLFVPTMGQTIIDWRFRDEGSKVNALTYTTTNASLSATNDPALQEKFEKRIARMKRGP